jgi:hypothetical protein
MLPARTSFRDQLRALYLACCDRRGWNAQRAVSAFETEAGVAIGSIQKVFAGDRHTLDLDSVDAMLDNLYDDGHGLISEAEKTAWHEALHVARAVDLATVQLLKQTNRNLPAHVLDSLSRDITPLITRYYRSTKELWGLHLVGLSALSSRLRTGAAVMKDPFGNNDNEWMPVMSTADEKSLYSLANLPGPAVTIANGALMPYPRYPIYALPFGMPKLFSQFTATTTVAFSGFYDLHGQYSSLNRGMLDNRHQYPSFAGLVLFSILDEKPQRVSGQKVVLADVRKLLTFGVNQLYGDVLALWNDGEADRPMFPELGGLILRSWNRATAVRRNSPNNLRVTWDGKRIELLVNNASVERRDFSVTSPLRVGIFSQYSHATNPARFTDFTLSIT